MFLRTKSKYFLTYIYIILKLGQSKLIFGLMDFFAPKSLEGAEKLKK